MSKIVVTNPVFPETIRALEACGDVVCNPNREPWGAERLIEELRDADAMMAFMTDCVGENLLQSAQRLKIVSCALKGYDNFDVAACTNAGTWVSIVPELLTNPTAELAVGLILGLNRKLLAGDSFLRSGQFSGWRAHLYGLGLDGSTVGIVGYGKVGRAVAQRLKGFGATLLAYDTKTTEARGDVAHVTLAELQSRSDVVVIALPLASDTIHLVDRRFLARLKPDVRVVNVGRGSVVKEADIAEALHQGTIGGYAADVFELEDWARHDHPRTIDARLLANEQRTLFTPHLGSAVEAVRRQIEMRAAANIIDALTGRVPRDAINDPRRSQHQPL